MFIIKKIKIIHIFPIFKIFKNFIFDLNFSEFNNCLNFSKIKIVQKR